MAAKAASSGVFTTTHGSNLMNDAAHGLVSGDCVSVASEATLPTGLSTSTYYYVISVTDITPDTFQLSLTPGGSAVTFSDDGTGDHTWYVEVIGDVLDVNEYEHIGVSVNIDGSPSVTVRCVGSIMDALPTFLNPQSVTNRYDFIQMVDHEDASTDDGDQGLGFTGEEHRQLVINVDGLSFITFKTLDFHAGSITIKVKGFRGGV